MESSNATKKANTGSRTELLKKKVNTMQSSDLFASSSARASDLRSHTFELEDEEIPHDEINLFDEGEGDDSQQ